MTQKSIKHPNAIFQKYHMVQLSCIDFTNIFCYLWWVEWWMKWGIGITRANNLNRPRNLFHYCRIPVVGSVKTSNKKLLRLYEHETSICRPYDGLDLMAKIGWRSSVIYGVIACPPYRGNEMDGLVIEFLWKISQSYLAICRLIGASIMVYLTILV